MSNFLTERLCSCEDIVQLYRYALAGEVLSQPNGLPSAPPLPWPNYLDLFLECHVCRRLAPVQACLFCRVGICRNESCLSAHSAWPRHRSALKITAAAVVADVDSLPLSVAQHAYYGGKCHHIVTLRRDLCCLQHCVTCSSCHAPCRAAGTTELFHRLKRSMPTFLPQACRDIQDAETVKLTVESLATPNRQPGSTALVEIAAGTVQGWRCSNEDAHVLKQSLPRSGWALCAVLDGHGGASVSTAAAAAVGAAMDDVALQAKHLRDRRGGEAASSTTSDSGRDVLDNTSVAESLCRAFTEIDRELRARSPLLVHGSTSGTTLLVLLIDPKTGRFWAASAGDCRLFRFSRSPAAPTATHASLLCPIHSPTLQKEQRRIEAAGRTVDTDGRIDGILNVSRGLGDFDVKDSLGVAGPPNVSVNSAATSARDACERRHYGLDPRVSAVSCLPDVTFGHLWHTGTTTTFDGVDGASTTDRTCAGPLTSASCPAVAYLLCCDGVLEGNTPTDLAEIIFPPSKGHVATNELSRRILKRSIAGELMPPSGGSVPLGLDNATLMLLMVRPSFE